MTVGSQGERFVRYDLLFRRSSESTMFERGDMLKLIPEEKTCMCRTSINLKKIKCTIQCII